MVKSVEGLFLMWRGSYWCSRYLDPLSLPDRLLSFYLIIDRPPPAPEDAGISPPLEDDLESNPLKFVIQRRQYILLQIISVVALVACIHGKCVR